MLASLEGMSRKGWWQLACWVVFGTLGCIAISVTYNGIAFWGHSPDAFRQGILSATILPILLAAPQFFYLTVKLRELAVANHKLSVLAATDSLTSVLNRGAFAERVGGRVTAVGADGKRPAGALLVIDADHFKSINDLHGHDSGDRALKLIAAAIRASIREHDLVGRLGGEEFGVFLPGSSYENALAVAERIRLRVERSAFSSSIAAIKLSVSIGGASFGEASDFESLFRIADERLYVAKHAGRNRVSMVRVPAMSPSPPVSLATH